MAVARNERCKVCERKKARGVVRFVCSTCKSEGHFMQICSWYCVDSIVSETCWECNTKTLQKTSVWCNGKEQTRP